MDPVDQVDSDVYYNLNEVYSYIDHTIHTLNEISQRLNIEPVSPPERSYLGSPLSSLSPTNSISHILKEGTPPRSPSCSPSPHPPSSPRSTTSQSPNLDQAGPSNVGQTAPSISTRQINSAPPSTATNLPLPLPPPPPPPNLPTMIDQHMPMLTSRDAPKFYASHSSFDNFFDCVKELACRCKLMDKERVTWAIRVHYCLLFIPIPIQPNTTNATLLAQIKYHLSKDESSLHS